MAITPTKPNKNTATITNSNKGMDNMTWEDADTTWEDADFTWDNPKIIVSKNNKNSASLTQPAKN